MENRDTHQDLRTMLHELCITAHSYYASLDECWRTADDIDFYRENYDDELQRILNYVQSNYQRKLK